MTQPLILWGHGATPNPVKVAIMMEELGLKYEVKEAADIKAEPFISLNPNGRLPAIEDPNTGVKLFESGAILEYLIDTYDKEAKFHYTTSPEKYLTQAWLHFQATGQGPYFGQMVWFTRFHSEKLPSAVERYRKEVQRVTSVLDAHLKKEGTKYLVGDKFTYADLAWQPWYKIIKSVAPDLNLDTDYPTFAKWDAELNERQSVKTVAAHPDLQFKK